MIDVRFRPLDRARWPGQPTDPYSRHTFKAGWQDTLNRLDYELCHLDAEHVIIEAAFRENDLRIDGWPKVNARTPADPGVIVSFDSAHGPLRYATDTYEKWEHNVRAIALGLEALRAVDRYGITHRAEQYVGYRALGAGTPMPAASPAMTVEEAADHIRRVLRSLEDSEILNAEGTVDRVCLDHTYRLAVKVMHPDVGGDITIFNLLTEARALLEAHAK